MMKKNIKKVLCIASLVGIMLLNSSAAMAYGQPYKFNVYKNGGVQKSGVVYKEDSERNAYVTVEDAMWSTQAPWVFGARVRTSSGQALTEYYTKQHSVGPMGYPGMPYLAGTPAYAGLPCQLNAQVDSSSASTIITIWGVWLP